MQCHVMECTYAMYECMQGLRVCMQGALAYMYVMHACMQVKVNIQQKRLYQFSDMAQTCHEVNFKVSVKANDQSLTNCEVNFEINVRQMSTCH